MTTTSVMITDKWPWTPGTKSASLDLGSRRVFRWERTSTTTTTTATITDNHTKNNILTVYKQPTTFNQYHHKKPKKHNKGELGASRARQFPTAYDKSESGPTTNAGRVPVNIIGGGKWRLLFNFQTPLFCQLWVWGGHRLGRSHSKAGRQRGGVDKYRYQVLSSLSSPL